MIKFKKLHADAIIPQYQTKGSSGFDFHAIEDVEFKLGEVKLIKTGLAVELPKQELLLDIFSGRPNFLYELQVRPRSGLSLKTGLRICNAPGTVDNDYSGEIGIIMQLLPVTDSGITSYTVKKGDRIAQGVVCPVTQEPITETETISETERGSSGYGSTGK